MKRTALLAALLLPLCTYAQEFAARTSAGADVKLAKGVHVGVEEEVRVGSDALDNMRTTLDFSVKTGKYLKFGGGYTLINPYKNSSSYVGFKNPRHRVFATATGTYKAGDFQFSLKEKLQLTQRTDTGFNEYQSVRNALALKSRLGVKYKGLEKFEPFAYFEIRTVLNEPWGTVSGSINYTENTDRAYYSYTPAGYTHAYVNRYRFNFGTDYSPAKKHSITLNLLADYCTDYVLDTNSSGSRLFTETTGWEDTFRLSLCLGYKYKF